MSPATMFYFVLCWYARHIKHPKQHVVLNYLSAKALQWWGPRDITFEVEIKGIKWRLNPTDYVQKELLLFGEWDAANLHFLKKVLPAGAVILDVGANFGYYSIVLAKHFGGNCRIYAFEPEPRVFELLKKHVELNDLQSCVEPIEAGLADKPGAASATVNSTNSGGTTLSINESGPLKLITLDDFNEEKQLRQVDFIKLDVEGLELLVLKGARKLLEEHRPLLQVEVSEGAMATQQLPLRQLFEVLRAARYSCCSLNGSAVVEYDYEEGTSNAELDVFCFPVEKHDELKRKMNS